MVSLVSFPDENARRQPDHLACVVGDDSLSYAELRDASCRLAPNGHQSWIVLFMSRGRFFPYPATAVWPCRPPSQ